MRCRRQADERRQVSSARETAMVDLRNEKERRGAADTAERAQTLHFSPCGKGACRLDYGNFTIEFDFSNLLLDDLVAAKQPANFAPDIRGYPLSVSSSVLIELRCPPTADPLAWHHDAVECTQAFDPADQPRPLSHKGLAFAAETFGVLFFDSRDANLSRYRTVASEPG